MIETAPNSETWRFVLGYEGLYEVSSKGRVRGMSNGQILSPQRDSRGYLVVCLSRNGVHRRFRVHRLVALAFLGLPPKGCEVNHKNGVRDDNRVENLEWASHSKNLRHAFRLGLCIVHSLKGEEHPASKLTSAQVGEIRRLRGQVSERKLASYFGVSPSLISAIWLRKKWRHMEAH
jgi:hypothetical protein